MVCTLPHPEVYTLPHPEVYLPHPEVYQALSTREVYQALSTREVYPAILPTLVYPAILPTLVYPPTHPGIYHLHTLGIPVHSLVHPPALGVSVATMVVSEHAPGLRSEINNEERPPCGPKTPKSVNSVIPPCAELLRSSLTDNREDRIDEGSGFTWVRVCCAEWCTSGWVSLRRVDSGKQHRRRAMGAAA